MAAVGQADDDSGVRTAANTHDGQSLTAKRVIGMGDGYPSRRGLGKRGSALGVCQLSAIAWCRWLPCWFSNRFSRRTCSRNNTPIDRTAGCIHCSQRPRGLHDLYSYGHVDTIAGCGCTDAGQTA
jgi:hypothetical protein